MACSEDMHRLHHRYLVLALALCASSGLGLLATAAAARAAPLAKVSLDQCLSGPAVADRSAVFRGSMREVRGTQRMWMRFTLEESVGPDDFEAKRAEGLGIWRKSREGVRGFVHRQNVLGLDRATAYRVRVQYRWLGESKATIKRATRYSDLCRQPGPRPDLRVGKITAKRLPETGGRVRYSVKVLNDGKAASSATSIRLTADGDDVLTGPVPVLGAGSSKLISLEGPACRSDLAAQVDPEGAVRERTERNNSRTGPCPLP